MILYTEAEYEVKQLNLTNTKEITDYIYNLMTEKYELQEVIELEEYAEEELQEEIDNLKKELKELQKDYKDLEEDYDKAENEVVKLEAEISTN